MALLVPNLQTVPNLKAGTVPGRKTVSTFGKTFLRQLSKSSLFLREVCKKSKWKFKIAFAMGGGGGLEGVSSATYLF